MDIELEQEMYIDPQIAEIKRRKKIEDLKWMDARKKAGKRECAILVTWILLFVMRYLKIAIWGNVININSLYGDEMEDRIVSVVQYGVIILFWVLFIMCIVDFIWIGMVADTLYMLLVAASWIFFRPVYMLARGLVLKDAGAGIRGGVWCIVYFFAVSYYAFAYFEEIVSMIASCG